MSRGSTSYILHEVTLYSEKPLLYSANSGIKVLSQFRHVQWRSSNVWLCRSMLARDLQSIVLYDQEGKFVGIRRPNSNLPIDIDGNKIVILDAIGTTGLELKVSVRKKSIFVGFLNLFADLHFLSD